MVGEQKKCSGFDSISSIGSLSVCVPDSCKIDVEVICYVCTVMQGIPLDVINVSVTSFAVFVFQYFAYCFLFSPIISLHVKFFYTLC